jgi:hypothetical protein
VFGVDFINDFIGILSMTGGKDDDLIVLGHLKEKRLKSKSLGRINFLPFSINFDLNYDYFTYV